MYKSRQTGSRSRKQTLLRAGAHNSKAILGQAYTRLLTGLKERVRAAQLKATLSANRELILLYWDIGRTIVDAQKKNSYGRQVVEKLAFDLSREFPAVRGFSALNLWRMRAFYLAYSHESPILSQAVTEFGNHKKGDSGTANLEAHSGVQRALFPILSQAVTESFANPEELGNVSQGDCRPASELLLLPWGHNLVLLHKLKKAGQRLWYARAAAKYGWSRAMLIAQIESSLDERQGHAINNFKATLPATQSELAEQALKDPYIFDFLTLDAAARERELEVGLLRHIEQFLVELGVGFAFVGRQYRLTVAEDEFAIDLLFYHLRLRCFVVVDLKMEAFKPEFAGKMNFYLSAIDSQLRHPEDRPSIGLLLCKENNRLVVEYALRDLEKPLGVAAWRARLVDSLPKRFESDLPTVAQIEAELAPSLRTRKTNRKRGVRKKRRQTR